LIRFVNQFAEVLLLNPMGMITVFQCSKYESPVNPLALAMVFKSSNLFASPGLVVIVNLFAIALSSVV
jgi:hypothetical protein